ncbi:hypothetical protein LBMAG53_10290 [Planctomycetota bacterium]|nr:hypothetical protein LBMAG53_10290 [Planctomycetota bacterium]
MRRAIVPALLAVLATTVPGQMWGSDSALTAPGTSYAVIDTDHLRALVPREAAEQLRPVVARAEALYVHLAADAGFVIQERLTLWFSDDADSHNGFSTVIPRPLVNIQLAPALPESAIFTGHDELERTIIHELAHHISNDRNPLGFRRFLDRVFGRVLPFDPLSLVVFYLATPAHVTMPSFWHEGLAQWAETTYAPAESPWAGRGRDSLTHMIWRMDAAAGAVPPVSDWRPSYHHWPYGSRVYHYGLAYTRWLEAAYGRNLPFWALVEQQSHQWFLSFQSATKDTIGVRHQRLIDRARADLLTEQGKQLAILRSQPVTNTKRLTPVEATVAAPAWLPDGRLVAAINGRFDLPTQRTISADGQIDGTGRTAWSMGGIRGLPDGTCIYGETDGSNDPWVHSRLHVLFPDGGSTTLPGERLLQPDLRRDGDTVQVVALQLQPGGITRLVQASGAIRNGFLGIGKRVDLGAWAAVPVEGRPWSPTFRPGTGELLWVETDAKGSRLVLAPLADPAKRTVLWTVKGRLLHPAWSADGSQLFVCADHTGVANAWRLDPAKPGVAVPVTNTLGGVLACVPSPDGKTLAILDHDRQGPFLARIANDPATWPPAVPEIDLAWPAPVAQDTAARPPLPERHPQPQLARPLPPPVEGVAGTEAPRPYWSLPNVRPLFWTPTTVATPEGGFGVAGYAADPLFKEVAAGGAGFGLAKGTPVGFAAWSSSALEWVQLAGAAWRTERAYGDQVVTADGQRHAYVERATGAQAAIGTGLAGFKRRWFGYVALGTEYSKQIPGLENDWDNQAVISAPRFSGREDYVEGVLAYDDTTFFPTSYAFEDGDTLIVKARHSDMGGELDHNRLFGTATKVISTWPRLGQQLVLGGLVGVGAGDPLPQGRFSIGGATGLGLPRGYNDLEATGDHALAWSAAYRFSVLPAFTWFGTTPFGFRQLIGEVFYDAAMVSEDHPGGHGKWYRSAGGELRAEWEIWLIRIAPGIGAAHLFQKHGEISPYFTLAFQW